MKKLSSMEREMLWNENGPYSEAKIVINTRILDDRISRVMVEVEGYINPTTFKVVQENIKEFSDDLMITQLLETAVYRGKEFGYHISAGTEEYTSNEVMQRAKEKLEYMKETIIKMHVFVMEYYDL